MPKINFVNFPAFILLINIFHRNLRVAIQFRTHQLLSSGLQTRLLTEAQGRKLWTTLKPTIDYLSTVGISSGSVLDATYDYEEETEEGFPLIG